MPEAPVCFDSIGLNSATNACRALLLLLQAC